MPTKEMPKATNQYQMLEQNHQTSSPEYELHITATVKNAAECTQEDLRLLVECLKKDVQWQLIRGLYRKDQSSLLEDSITLSKTLDHVTELSISTSMIMKKPLKEERN